MKARVKATGEIVEVQEEYDLSNAMVEVFYSNVEDSYDTYEREELDFNIKDDNTPDYWTRLEHQYAGMAMQGILGNPEIELDYEGNEGYVQAVTATAARFAHALVEKMKEERE